MPEDEGEHSESENFDPALLLDRPVVASASSSSDQLEQNPRDTISSAPTSEAQSPQSNLLSTEDLLALRTQITDNMSHKRDQSDTQDAALSDRLSQAKSGQAKSAQAKSAQVKSAQAKPDSIHTSLGTSIDAQNQPVNNANQPDAEQPDFAADLPPWETASINSDAISQSDRDGSAVVASPPVLETAASPTSHSPPSEGLFEDTDTQLPADQPTDFQAEQESDSQYKAVDFEIPVHLSDGTKVVKASQLDTWSQLIEAMGLSGLTKQVAIHSMYKMQGDTVQLTVAEDKKHLVAPKIIQQLAEALSQALRHQVSVALDYGNVTDTPFAVQQAVNRMRMHYAHQTIAADPQVQLLCQTFNAEVNSGSIKPK